MIVCFAMVDACAGERGFAGTWRLRSIDATPLESRPADQVPFFTISGAAVEGFDGCNRFAGSLDQPGAIAATRRGCPDATLMLPLDLNDLDAHLRSGRIEGDVLSVPARGPYPSSTYVRDPGFGASP